ncbi:chemotaxis protein CheW [Gottschalkia purinilytica]|uniref:Chemotaxis protein CheW n=1 Tax=Gottschalkia purinilytica TaxID=1503 RepID=A0A0L0WBM0_GOTPU|nr:chemotaxis protein CheW [Gottschalkia purinilytica]KNF08837.1 chemotaxis protein CheW [Gottschalkia purinilytica]
MSSLNNENQDLKYVIFKLEEEYYGIDINNVMSIEKAQDFTRVPNSPNYIKGVINLRGEVIPVIDLRNRFRLNEKEIDTNSRIIIVFVSEIQVGLLVDSSSEVMTFTEDEIDSAPSIKENISENFIKSIGKKDNKLIVLLNLENVVGIDVSE